MRLFGLNITIGLIVVALLFYFIGAKKPGLANKFFPG